MALEDWPALVVAVLVPLAVGGVGGAVTAPAIPTWYRALRKPAWNPPAWLFGPVWTVLYVLMGIAAWLVWRRGWTTPGVPAALLLFTVQLGLNLAWSIVFFGRRQLGWAVIEICCLWVALAVTLVQFAGLSLAAAVVLVPYLVWVSFATALTLAIWRLNPTPPHA